MSPGGGGAGKGAGEHGYRKVNIIYLIGRRPSGGTWGLPARAGGGYAEFMTVRCPTCRKPVSWYESPYRPFCSERCKLLDLDRWVREDYRIPAQEDESEGSGDPGLH